MDLAVEMLRTIMMAFTLSASAMDIENDSYMDEPLFCMAQNIYHEAGNQDFDGKVAVGFVTRTRVRHDGFPDDICGVVKQGPTYTNWKGNTWPQLNQCQFSWNCDGKSDDINLVRNGKVIDEEVQAWHKSIQAAILVMLDLVNDPTNGATHYYNPNKANPSWRHEYPEVARIGEHTFRKRRS
jgi:spore germination cell wall hydrolase CwlJ-like protein